MLSLLAMIGMFTPTVAQPTSKVGDRLETIRAVTEQVWRTFSDDRISPMLEMVSAQSQPSMACFRWKPKPTIIINEKLYDVCRSFDRDSLTALAIVIGHELTHYHADHKEWMDLAQERRLTQEHRIGTASKGPLLSDAELSTLELLADRQGVRHAFVAGYDNGFRLFKPLYEHIYKTFKPVTSSNYPNKLDRVRYSLAQTKSARSDAVLVDIATFLFAIESYTDVDPFLTETLDRWPLASLKNNLAALYIKKALSLTECQDMPFRLPVEWDSYNRLLILRGKASAKDKRQKDQLLEQAQSYASQAYNTDPSYKPAKLNLAITYLLQGRRYGQAEDLLNELIVPPQTDPNALLLKALLRFKRTKNFAAFREDFASVTGADNEPFNRAALEAWPTCPGSTEGISTVTLSLEPGLGAIKLPYSLSTTFPINIEVPGPRTLIIEERFYPESGINIEALRITVGQASRYDVLKTTSPNWQTALGLKVGQSEEMINTLYGLPDARIELNDQNCMYHYKHAGLLVTVQRGKIFQLTVYRKSI